MAHCFPIYSIIYNNYLNYIEGEIPNNCKKFWHFVSAKSGSTTIPMDMKYKTQRASDNQSISNLFAEYFQSVFQPHLNSSALVSVTLGHAGLNCLHIDESEVSEVLGKLDPKKGPGCDDIPSIFVRNCTRGLCAPLTKLFNQSLTTGIFPAEWKHALVIPILKSGDKKNVENYRGISKLCIFAKIFEKVVYKYLFSLVKIF